MVKLGKLSIGENGFIMDKKNRVFIPEIYKRNFLRKIHVQLIHPGIKRTYMTLKNYICCDKLKRCIAMLIKECEICAKTKILTKTYGYSTGNLYCNKPFLFVSSDIFEPIKSKHFITKNDDSYFYLITFTDIFSRFTEAFYLRNITSENVIKSFKKWCEKYGFPHKFLSDQGRQYIVQILEIL
ncbi:Gag-Pol polyprotein [Dictyocoela muelleri]|nr:Gag-Pol polyprotein [Dictyocoela muelleri]